MASTFPGKRRGEPMRLLIVEDEALVALEVESILGSAGHEVIGTADTLHEALEVAEAERPDLALVDIQLAEGNSGLDVAAALKARGIPTLFATGNCPTERGAGLALGCLHKPFTDRSLASAIDVADAVLRGQTPTRLPQALHLY